MVMKQSQIRTRTKHLLKNLMSMELMLTKVRLVKPLRLMLVQLMLQKPLRLNLMKLYELRLTSAC